MQMNGEIVAILILFIAACKSITWAKKYLIKKQRRTARHHRWKTLRDEFLKMNPTCAVCGKKTELVVHHKLPFWKFPQKELDWDNLITLCENQNLNCHFVIGHLMDWTSYNPKINEDIEYFKNKLISKKKRFVNSLWW